MYPTLLAVRDFGGAAMRSEMVEKVPEIAGISDEQLAVVFPEDSKHQGKSKGNCSPGVCISLKNP